jgi:S1-C subfamily serine protease
MEFGGVQRGILGIEGNELNSKISKELGLEDAEGFYIGKVTKNSGAEKAGLKKGDVIKKLDSQKINSYAELSGYINTKRPNDKVEVTFVRDGETKTASVTLIKNDVLTTEYKGLELENIDSSDKKRYKIDYGVRIKEINNENLKPYSEQLRGGIILSVNGVKATDVESISSYLNKNDENQNVSIQMINRNGQVMQVIL